VLQLRFWNPNVQANNKDSRQGKERLIPGEAEEPTGPGHHRLPQDCGNDH
jgi:hypothetical protein